jgi:hypothetical protein
MNYYDNFRRLTCDVYNPDHDKRVRYGANAIEVLKEGTALYEFTTHPTDKYTPGSISFYRSGDRSDNVYTVKGFGKALLDNSVISEPRSWRERVRFATGFNTYPNIIIDQLIESGVVTPEQVEQAARDADKE